MRLVSMFLILIALPGAARAEQDGDRGSVTDQDRTRGHRMLQKVRETLERYYYDSTFHGIDLEQHVRRTDSAIARATTMPELVSAIADFLHVLDDSHTRFYPPTNAVSVNYGWSWTIIGEECYVTAVREASDAAAKGLRIGDRVLAIDGIKPTRENSSLIRYVYDRLSPRPGMRLLIDRDGAAPTDLIVMAEITRGATVQNLADIEARRRAVEESERNRPRHRTVQLDSVMVWRMPSFTGGDTDIDRLMNRARASRWLILDLRGNGGGAIEALMRLLGHFFAEPVDAYTEVWRDSTVVQRVVPRGDGPFTGNAVILIDSRSASSSEMASRVLQMRGRATVVGDRSMGAVQTSYQIDLRLGSQYYQERFVDFRMSVTITDVVMPDGQRLEKFGVIPNVAALPTGADLAAKRDPAMQFALEMAGVKMSAEDAGKVFGSR